MWIALMGVIAYAVYDEHESAESGRRTTRRNGLIGVMSGLLVAMRSSSLLACHYVVSGIWPG